MKGPVLTLKMFNQYLAYSVGYRLCLHRWENHPPESQTQNSIGMLHLVTFYDAGFCITSLNIIKNYITIGDIHKGLFKLK